MSTLTAGRYAAVASTLALAVALGGTSYAAVKIGTADIKNGAVTAPKIRAGAVGPSAVKNGALTGADLKDNALTGADVDEGTLAAVPNSVRTGDNYLDDLRFSGATSSGPVVIFNRAGLQIRAACSGASPSLPQLTATTTEAESSIYTVVHGDGTPAPADPSGADLETGDFDLGETFNLLAGGNGNIGLVTFDYRSRTGKVVSGHVVTDSVGPGCTVDGFAIADR